MPNWSFLPDFPGVILLVSSHLQGTLSQQQNRDVAPGAYLLVVSMDCNSPQFEFCAVFPACQRTGGAPQNSLPVFPDRQNVFLNNCRVVSASLMWLILVMRIFMVKIKIIVMRIYFVCS
ncbi:hypothetical protein YQ16_10180 [Salmonella enterica subsp. enterica]|nr:hypothetical protein [Salmonella enterica subsp. enterica serovar Liverpool]